MNFEDNLAHHERHSGHPWRTGVIKRFPVVAVLSLIGSLVATAAAVAIVRIADGSQIAWWKYPPTVYLSIAYTIANILLSVTLGQGAAIAWWISAQGGRTTVRGLHYAWSMSTSVWGALTAGRHFNRVAVVCIIMTLVPANGPLLQRAISVSTRPLDTTTSVQIPIARSLDVDTATLSGRNNHIGLLSPEFTAALQDYTSNARMIVNVSGCASSMTCKGSIPGLGFAINCSLTTAPLHLVPDGLKYPTSQNDPAFNGSNIFQTSITVDNIHSYSLNVSALHKSAAACTGEATVQTCSLQLGTVQYPILIDGNSSIITLDPQSTIFDDVAISKMPDPGLRNVLQDGRLGGFGTALSSLFTSSALMSFGGGIGYIFTPQGIFQSQFLLFDGPRASTNCTMYYADPMPAMLQGTRDLAFRLALKVAAANSTMVRQAADLAQVGITTVYVANYTYLAVASGLTLLGCLATASLLFRYWQLGRDVTLSPVEVAKAFNAPLLANVPGNATVDEMISQSGTGIVRYGRYVPPSSYARPNDDSSDSVYSGKSPVVLVRRAGEHELEHLVIAEFASVRPPLQDVSYR